MQHIWTRLKGDFQLSILTLVALCSFLGVGPYSVYRLIEGNWLVGVLDAVLVLQPVRPYCTRGAQGIRCGQASFSPLSIRS